MDSGAPTGPPTGPPTDPTARRQRRRALVLVGVALAGSVAVAVHRFSATGGGPALVGLGIVAVVVVVVVAAVHLVLRRRLRRVQGLVGPGGWAAPCGWSADPQVARALALTDEGLALVVLTGRGEDLGASWDDVAAVQRCRTTLGLWRVHGVRLQLVSGEAVDLAFPGRSQLTFPAALADAAYREVESRRARAAARR